MTMTLRPNQYLEHNTLDTGLIETVVRQGHRVVHPFGFGQLPFSSMNPSPSDNSPQLPLPPTTMETMSIDSHPAANKVRSSPLCPERPNVQPTTIMSALGLPALPKAYSTASTTVVPKLIADVFSLPETAGISVNKIQSSTSEFSVLDHYGCRQESMDDLLLTTYQLMSKLPGQTAADIVMDMPEWMRQEFLSRYRMPPLVDSILSSRLEGFTEEDPIDNMVAVHADVVWTNAMAAGSVIDAGEDVFISGMASASRINRLTVPCKSKVRKKIQHQFEMNEPLLLPTIEVVQSSEQPANTEEEHYIAPSASDRLLSAQRMDRNKFKALDADGQVRFTESRVIVKQNIVESVSLVSSNIDDKAMPTEDNQRVHDIHEQTANDHHVKKQLATQSEPPEKNHIEPDARKSEVSELSADVQELRHSLQVLRNSLHIGLKNMRTSQKSEKTRVDTDVVSNIATEIASKFAATLAATMNSMDNSRVEAAVDSAVPSADNLTVHQTVKATKAVGVSSSKVSAVQSGEREGSAVPGSEPNSGPHLQMISNPCDKVLRRSSVKSHIQSKPPSAPTSFGLRKYDGLV